MASAFAQTVTIRPLSTAGTVGSLQPTEVAVWSTPTEVQFSGWILGICFDESRLIVQEIEPSLSIAPLEFFSSAVVPGGWTSNAIISSTGSFVLAPGYTLRPLVRAVYEVVGPPSTTSICSCDSLGVPLELTTPTGPLTPDPSCGSFVIQETTLVELDLVDRQVYYSVDSPAREFTIDVTLAQPDGVSSSEPQGFSFGVLHDSSVIEPINFFTLGQLSYFGSTSPFSGEFLQFTIHPEGWTVGCVFGGFHPLVFGPEPEGVLRALYVTHPDSFDGSPAETELQFTRTLGNPPVSTVVVVGGAALVPTTDNGYLTFLPFDGDLFRRGDCNQDGSVDIADGVTILSEQFAGAAPTTCPAACDLNLDAIYDIADPIYLFNFILLGGPPPPHPFETCGAADTPFPCPNFYACD